MRKGEGRKKGEERRGEEKRGEERRGKERRVRLGGGRTVKRWGKIFGKDKQIHVVKISTKVNASRTKVGCCTNSARHIV